jgi:hypothetical protein
MPQLSTRFAARIRLMPETTRNMVG